MTRKELWIRIALTLPIAAVFVFSGLRFLEAEQNYKAEAEMHTRMLAFKPKPEASAAPAPSVSSAPSHSAATVSPEETPVYNAEIAELRRQNSDIVGWISVEDTAIDYPFARGPDNDFYLRRDLDKQSAYAGTIFMDYRCHENFSDFNTVLYGHNMKNGSMFHALAEFADRNYFDTHTSGVIYLENANISVEIFAFLLVQPIDLMAFAEREDYLEYVYTNAQYTREAELGADDRLVTLSTCSYQFNDARAVVVGKIVEG